MIPITIRDLRKVFGQTLAVDGVCLDIAAGDLFFLLGPSGCGKTTLLRMLAGFTDPTAGAIRFGEREVTHLPPNRRNTGMVFQGYALWPHMSVAQNVAFGLNVRKVPAAERDARVQQALQLVQMSHLAQRKPNELSGGQQQRVALARALVIRPDVLLLDEPLSNLDAKLRLEMRGQIKQICKDAGTTAVYVTHDQKEALSMADGMAVLSAGRIVQTGRPREVYDRPVNRFVAEFLGETNFIPATLAGRDRDRVLLTSPAGRLASSVFPADLPAAGGVTCSIRPEALRLLRQEQPLGEASDNQLRARRSETVYLGEMAQHLFVSSVAGGSDTRLKLFELNPRPLDKTDREYVLTCDPADVVILRD